MDVLKWIQERWGTQTRLKAVRDLQPGMVVGENVRCEGVVLVKKGATVDEGVIGSLTKKKVSNVIVVSENVPPSESKLAEIEASLLKRFEGYEKSAEMNKLKNAMLGAYRDGVYE